MKKLILLSIALLSLVSCRNIIIPLGVDNNAPTEAPEVFAETAEKAS